jgi:hypothetical protein
VKKLQGVKSYMEQTVKYLNPRGLKMPSKWRYSTASIAVLGGYARKILNFWRVLSVCMSRQQGYKFGTFIVSVRRNDG